MHPNTLDPDCLRPREIRSQGEQELEESGWAPPRGARLHYGDDEEVESDASAATAIPRTTCRLSLFTCVLNAVLN